MITSLTLKSKDAQNRLTRPDEGPAHKALLLLMVRLIHADPMLLLNVCFTCFNVKQLYCKLSLFFCFAEFRKSRA